VTKERRERMWLYREWVKSRRELLKPKQARVFSRRGYSVFPDYGEAKEINRYVTGNWGLLANTSPNSFLKLLDKGQWCSPTYSLYR
jgi:hypothetical protein